MDASDISRRNVLKALGITASGVSVAGLVEARGSATNEFLRTARRSGKVRKLMDELNISAIKRSNSKQIDVSDTDNSLRIAEFVTSAGTLLFGRTADGEESAMVKIGDGGESNSNTGSGRSRGLVSQAKGVVREINPPKPYELPQKYRNLPSETNPTLIGTEEGTEFRRFATSEEKRVVNEVTDIDVHDATVVAGSDLNGFAVVSESNESIDTNHQGTSAEPNADRVIVSIDGGDREFTTPVATDISPDDLQMKPVSVQYHNHPCASWCLTWVMSTSACLGCTAACVIASPTGAGVVLCAICMFGTCVSSVYAMGGCGHCLDEEGLI